MKKITLKYPIKVDGKEAKELTLIRPTVKDMRLADAGGKTEGERELALFAGLLGICPADLDGMDMADYKQVQEAYAGFLS